MIEFTRSQATSRTEKEWRVLPVSNRPGFERMREEVAKYLRDRIAGRRAVFEWVDAAQWPMTAATKDVAAQWISTEQFVWSVDRLLDGIADLRARPD